MDKKEVFKNFVTTHEILIVDKNASSRNRLLKIMTDLGCKRNTIHTVGSYREAEEIITTKKVGVVLSDYQVEGGSGFDLFKMIREKNPDKKELCLILVTSNISQSAVAKAAEEDVDSFVIKPYTIQSIQENLVATISSKVAPSPYIVKVDEGKDLIFKGMFDEALVSLKEALRLHSKPALALFYIGQAEYLKKEISKAQGSYDTGLSFSNIHFKCLVGLYDLYLKDEKYYQAYEVVKKVATYFPANPDRLTQIIHLAVRTQNFVDMQSYYEIFKTIEERTSNLVNYIGAGMYVSGKHLFVNGEQDAAILYFDNIAVSCSEFTKFLRAIITLLVENDRVADAKRYLDRFPKNTKDSEDFLVSDYMIIGKELDDQNALIKFGLDLYNQGLRDYNCITILIGAMEKQNYKPEKIEPFRAELMSRWPEKFLDAA